jgi:DUF4097 and DUF4098 domain-containing protein YvlB
MRFQTGSGNVRGRELSGPAKVKAGSGDIEIEETGRATWRSAPGSGNITANGINGGFHAEAGSGDIHGKGVPKNMWSVRTGSGNVNLNVPADAAFDVDVSSSSGSVTLGHPVTTTVQGRIQESRKSVVGKVRGGGPMISVHTGSGDVQGGIERRHFIETSESRAGGIRILEECGPDGAPPGNRCSN